MKITMFGPDAALQEFVACMFIAESYIEHPELDSFSPFPPNPQNSMLLYVKDPVEIQTVSGSIVKSDPCLLTGPHTERINSRLGKYNLLVYVGFKPGALYRLLGIPMKLLINHAYNGTDYFGSEINDLIDQLNEAGNYNAMINLVTKFLINKISHLRCIEPFDYAMNCLIKMDGNISVDKLTAISCLSIRQFERKCNERIGLPPKLYARIARFSKAYRMREMHPNLSWTHIAHTAGYYDQMHFIRDFKTFAGVTPTMMDEELNHTVYKLQAGLII